MAAAIAAPKKPIVFFKNERLSDWDILGSSDTIVLPDTSASMHE